MTPVSSAVIFDMDGTLIDPFLGIRNSYAHMCKEMGLSPLSVADVQSFIGPPIQEALAKHFSLANESLEHAVRTFRNYYSSTGIHEFSKYPAIDELLKELRSAGYRAHIATNKPEAFAQIIVNSAGWSDLFSVVSGSTLDGSVRHKTEIIANVLAQLPPEEKVVAYVGDRPEDALSSLPYGLSFVGVSWGYSTTDQLLAAGATQVANSAQQLKEALLSLAITR